MLVVCILSLLFDLIIFFGNVMVLLVGIIIPSIIILVISIWILLSLDVVLVVRLRFFNLRLYASI
jgi:hypothetical protein